MLHLKGALENINKDYSQPEREHLIKMIAKFGGNLFVWCKLRPKYAYKPIKNLRYWPDFKKIVPICKKYKVKLWVGLKPGSHNWRSANEIHPESDPTIIIKNAEKFIEFGANGIYLFADDTRGRRVSHKDGFYHAFIIKELIRSIGERFKGFCGEEYSGNLDSHPEYWEPIKLALPENRLITWTGPETNSKKIRVHDLPRIEYPLLLHDNFFRVYQTKPYRFRDSGLKDNIECLLINLGPNYRKQFMAIFTSLKWVLDPDRYDPIEAKYFAERHVKKWFKALE